MLTNDDITKIKEALTPDFDGITSEIRNVNSRLDVIEKNIKSVVRIHNLDEEMTAVYERLKRVEVAVGIGKS